MSISSVKTLKSMIVERLNQESASMVWTPIDFIELGKRDAIDKTLQRLVSSGQLQRIDRGLYTKLRKNTLTQRLAAPDYEKVIEAVRRRDQVRVLVDGMSAANALGLTNAVPGQIIVHTDGRLRPIHIENLIIQFKLTAPSKLYWADNPAMYIVQALYWLHNSWENFSVIEQKTIELKLIRLLHAPNKNAVICNDLQAGLHTVPTWMQDWIRRLITPPIEP